MTATAELTEASVPPLPPRADFVAAYVRTRPGVREIDAGKIYDLLAGPPYEFRGAIVDWAAAFMAVEEARR